MTFDPDDIARAVENLKRGELVAFPTETVYGLGADAMNPQAVARIFAYKGRPQDHPVIVHIAASEYLGFWAREISPIAQRLAAAFWPGPLTLIVPRASHVLDLVTGNQDTVGVRCPAHSVALALLHAAHEAGIKGVAAPSANRFGHVSPTTAAHVQGEFRPDLFILDGGACEVGIESTIVDVTSATPRILRPGMISADAITTVLKTALSTELTHAPRVSGALAQHYSPHTPLTLVASENVSTILSQASSQRVVLVSIVPCDHSGPSILLPNDPASYARQLYAALREADLHDADLIALELPPTGAEWVAIHDRLRRAAEVMESSS